jgi:hypothetical protein
VKKRSEFLAWFEAQYGKRPSKLDINTLATLAGDAEHASRMARQEYEGAMEWEEWHDVALKAWQAKGGGR